MEFTKNTYEVRNLKGKRNKEPIDKNFFKAMNYEFAGEIGKVDSEEMKNNKFLKEDAVDNEQMTRLQGAVDTLAWLKTMREQPK